MTWFVASIELTIRWNHIEGVSTIRTTGQLIPFIIGIASFGQAVKKVVIYLIIKVRDASMSRDYHNYKVKLTAPIVLSRLCFQRSSSGIR
jgi:hypothetical protein